MVSSLRKLKIHEVFIVLSLVPANFLLINSVTCSGRLDLLTELHINVSTTKGNVISPFTLEKNNLPTFIEFVSTRFNIQLVIFSFRLESSFRNHPMEVSVVANLVEIWFDFLIRN